MTRSKAQKLLPGPSMSETMLSYFEGCRRGANESPASPAIPGPVAMFSIRRRSSRHRWHGARLVALRLPN